MYKRFFKRFLDVFLSFWGLFFLWPVMAIIALVIKCESKGPAVFKNNRVGKNNKTFLLYKFRSMSVNAPSEVATRNIDAKIYITKVGKFIRKTSLDELPQIWNILKGDMSIIGPRPVVTTENDLIEKRNALNVYSVRPGLTGLAQINGRDNLVDMDLKARFDSEYVKNIKFVNDIKIFFKTILQIFSHEGIVEGTKVVNEVYIQQNIQKVPQLNFDKSELHLVVADIIEQDRECLNLIEIEDNESLRQIIAMEKIKKRIQAQDLAESEDKIA